MGTGKESHFLLINPISEFRLELQTTEFDCGLEIVPRRIIDRDADGKMLGHIHFNSGICDS